MKFVMKIHLILLVSLLAACGGGGGGSGGGANPGTQPAPETPSPDPEPEPEPEPTPGPELSLMCTGSEALVVSAVNATDFIGDFSAGKTVDTSFSAEARWSSDATDAAITFDFGGLAKLSDIRLAWYLGDQRNAFYSVEASSDDENWQPVVLDAESSGTTADFEVSALDDLVTRYLRIVGNGNSQDNETSLLEFAAAGCRDEPVGSSLSPFEDEPLEVLPPYDHSSLDPMVPPSENFDLLDWYLSIPTDTDGNGRSDSIFENELAGGYENPDYFYTASDGGMVFRSPVNGFKTSTNTSYVRVEFREMLRRGNTSISTRGVNNNNWVFGSSPEQARSDAGGVDGRLFATLAVNEVTTTGENFQIGRVIIGQIHANDDEPARLYYRKLPGNSRGSIYVAHEILGGDDEYYELVGSRSNSADDPADGVALDEKFSYQIEVVGDFLRVSLLRPGREPVFTIIDMSDSGYDAADQFQYFKLGAYHVNNSADVSEFAEVTFYDISVDHD